MTAELSLQHQQSAWIIEVTRGSEQKVQQYQSLHHTTSQSVMLFMEVFNTEEGRKKRQYRQQGKQVISIHACTPRILRMVCKYCCVPPSLTGGGSTAHDCTWQGSAKFKVAKTFATSRI
jgi:hypothetical protein